MVKHTLATNVRVKQFNLADKDRKGQFTNCYIDVAVPYQDRLSCVFTEHAPRVTNPLSLNVKTLSDDPTEAQAQVDQDLMVLNLLLLECFDKPSALIAMVTEDLPAWLHDIRLGMENDLFRLAPYNVMDQRLFQRIRDSIEEIMPGKFKLSVKGVMTFNGRRMLPLDYLTGPRYRNGLYDLFGMGDNSHYSGHDQLVNSYTRLGYPKGALNNYDFTKERLARVYALGEWLKTGIESLPSPCFVESELNAADLVALIDEMQAEVTNLTSSLATGFKNRDEVIRLIKEKGILESNPRYQKAMELGLGERAVTQIMTELGPILAEGIQKDLNELLKREAFQVKVSCYNLKEAWDRDARNGNMHDDNIVQHVDCPQESALTTILALKKLGQDPFYRQLFNSDNWFVEVQGWIDFDPNGSVCDENYHEMIQIRAGLNTDIFQPTDILQIWVKG
jgi:hypothetical protein